MKDKFEYIFRFCCDPGFNDDREIDALNKFVDEADIDDVAVFANVEEINTGHMSYEEQDIYLSLIRRIMNMLAPKGITVSVNQWHSIMHADLGKKMRPGQNFRPMVDIRGNRAKLCVCPLCKEWQQYIGALYARYAELAPSILWVEDDFRLHNHEPLVWGGCFCDEHMAIYSQRAGKKLTREEFVAKILQPGQPHPYRKIWLDVSRDTLLEAAEAIAKAVRMVSSKQRIGLMSSVPQVHAAEGRDWEALLRTFSAGCKPIDRIHLPAYQEISPSKYLQGFNMVSMLNRAFIPEETQVYPELENYPYSLFSKSRTFTRFQLLSSLPLMPDGMTIDLYDLNGNGIVWENGYQNMLHDTKPFLDKVKATGVFEQDQSGVRVLVNPMSSYTIHTNRGKNMEELYPQDAFFAGLLPAMGIPYSYVTQTELSGEIVAIAGQVLRNYSTDKITRLFHNNYIILNGDAVWTLIDMGLGNLAGVQDARWEKQNSGTYAYEQITNGKEYCGRENARASAIISCSDVLNISYQTGASVAEYSAMYNSFRERTMSGQSVVDHKVMIFPFGHFEGPSDIPPMLLNQLRQEVFTDIISNLWQADFPVVTGEAYLEPYSYHDGDASSLYLVNGSSDASKKITVKLGKAAVFSDCIVYRSERTTPEHIDVTKGKGENEWVLPLTISPMETALVTYISPRK